MPIFLRILSAFVLLTLTFNPTQINYISWVQNNWAEQMSLAVLGGLLLSVGYIIFLRATFRSIGPLGMGLILALFASLLWVMVDFGFISLSDPEGNAWIALVGLSLMLGIGLSWSIIRRRLSGQYDIDDIDE